MEVEETIKLIRIVRYSKSKRARSKARRKLLRNQESLEKIVKDCFNHKEVCSEYSHAVADIIKYIKDEKLLSEIALNANETGHRRSAIDNPNLKDEEVLVQVALKETGCWADKRYVKKESIYNISLAIEKINNQSLLEKIAKESKDEYVLIKVLIKITSQKLLGEYALSHPSVNVRKAAVGGINDQEILDEIFYAYNYISVKCIAIKNMKNTDSLRRIALNRKYSQDRNTLSFCMAAIESIDDEDALIYIAKSGNRKDFRKAAIENPNLRDEEILVDFAKYDESPEVRLAAIKKITRQDVLIDVALHDENADVTADAVGRINSKNVLVEIAENNHDSRSSFSRRYVSKAAKDRLKEIEQLGRYRQVKLLDEK